VRNGKAVIYCDRVEIAGPSKLVYTPEKPLETGQTAYITTKAPVVAFGVRYDDDNKDEKRSVKEIESEPRRSGCF
jgi:hypothetical protein